VSLFPFLVRGAGKTSEVSCAKKMTKYRNLIKFNIQPLQIVLEQDAEYRLALPTHEMLDSFHQTYTAIKSLRTETGASPQRRAWHTTLHSVTAGRDHDINPNKGFGFSSYLPLSAVLETEIGAFPIQG
jgi:hypothetical protein